jgi:hypothetical protein
MNRVILAGGVTVILLAGTILGVLLTDELTGLPEDEALKVYELCIDSWGAADGYFVENEQRLAPKAMTWPFVQKNVPIGFKWAVDVLAADTTTGELSDLANRGQNLVRREEARQWYADRREFQLVSLSPIGFDRETGRAAVYSGFLRHRLF